MVASTSLETTAEHSQARGPDACGLYVHTPFCHTKCGYCDFYSVALKDRDTAPLVDALIDELGRRLSRCNPDIRTVFIGGGTPTVLEVSQLARLLAAIDNSVVTASLDDFTVEANPATVDDAKAELLASRGVQRVSLGAQSFVQAELDVLERLHNPAEVGASVSILRRAGIGQINLDLIFGTPGQTVDSWRYSLETALALKPNHLACYGLTYEPGTRLTAQRDHGRVQVCPEDLELELYELTVDLLAERGYAQYEISNYALPGCESAHNLLYWRNEPYIGVGPSAVGFQDGRRYKNVCGVTEYVRMVGERGHAEMECERISPNEIVTELVMMQLRLNAGLCVRSFRDRTGLDPLVVLQPALDRLSHMGMLTADSTRIALTRRGRPVANAVIRELAFAAEGHFDVEGPKSKVQGRKSGLLILDR